MKKILLILFIILITLVLAGYYLYNAKGLVENSNENVQKSLTTKKADESLEAPINQRLIVPTEFQTGAFATERALNLPAKYQIKVFAAGMKGPRVVISDGSGGLYVSDKKAGKIMYLKDNNGDSKAEVIQEIISGLRNVHGLDMYQGNLYFAEEDKVSVLYGIKGAEFVRREVVVADLPSDGGHVTRTAKVGPDGKLYVSVGSSCNICEENDSRRAAIVRYNLDGSGQEIFATGLRNTVDFIFDAENKMWSVDNGRDNLGENTPPEEVNIIQFGRNYGWPYCYGDKVANPEYLDRQEFCERSTTAPKYNLQAHSAPLGLTFGPSGYLENNLFVAFHGSWNRSVPTGYKVIRIDTKSVNQEPIDFVYGWLQENGIAWGRPVDIKVYDNDKFLITDDSAGAVYIVEPR